MWPAMSLGRRIKEIRQRRRLSQAALAKILAVSRNAVSMWENGKSRPSSEHLEQLAKVLEVEHEWLATGRKQPQSRTARGLPLLGSVAAGVWREQGERQDMEVNRVPVAPDPAWPEEAQYALKVEGNSINRVAADGTTLHCVDIYAAGIEVRDHDLVVVERARAGLIETTVKRVRSSPNGLQLWPESNDSSHQRPIAVAAKGAEVTVKALVISVTTPIHRGRP